MNGKRYRSVDIAKGIAIVCIILGHLGIDEINRVVFTFHVPLFYLITGYFFNSNHSLFQLVYKKARKLLAPYFLACVGIIISSVIINYLKGDVSVIPDTIKNWGMAALYGAGDIFSAPEGIWPIGAIWFLLAMFWASILLRIIINRDCLSGTLFVFCFFIICHFSSNYFWFPFAIQASGPALLYMYIGYMLAQAGDDCFDIIKDSSKSIILLLALIIWVWFIIDFKGFWLVHCDVGAGASDIIRSLCGCISVISVSLFIDSHFDFVARAFSYLGKYSLVVLCMHIIELDTFPWDVIILKFGTSRETIFGILLLIAIKLLWAVGMTLVITHIDLTRVLFGYNRAIKDTIE